jgi:hypothetical protein
MVLGLDHHLLHNYYLLKFEGWDTSILLYSLIGDLCSSSLFPKEKFWKRTRSGDIGMGRHLPQLQAKLHHLLHTPYYSIIPVERTVILTSDKAMTSTYISPDSERSRHLEALHEQQQAS